MPSQPLRILATADVHMGSGPSKINDAELEKRLSCTTMWGDMVDRAILEKVDLVALAGDVVDHENRFYEATGPLERGLRKLGSAGIDTYAVSGNHDWDVLPRIADTIGADAAGADHFHLLGRGGRWEEAVFHRDGRPALRIHGWSFPRLHVQESPLPTYDLSLEGDLPTLGLLHADLDAGSSDYAPVTSTELQARPLTLWLLGHVHRPMPPEPLSESLAGPTILYPGSPQAMDPGETGPHGPWLIEIDGGGRVSARQLDMSSVRYDELALDLSDVDTQAAFEVAVSGRLRDHLSAVIRESECVKYVSLRLTLTGRTRLCGALERWIGPLVEQYDSSLEGVAARIEKVVNNTLPAIDLDELAAKSDPTGVLARTLLGLASAAPPEDLAKLIRDARATMREAHHAVAYGAVRGDPEPSQDDARQCLQRQASRLLDKLLAREEVS